MISTIFPSAREQKNGGYTYLCAGSVICVSLLRATQHSIFACCLIVACVRWYRRDFLYQEKIKQSKMKGIQIALRWLSDICIPPRALTVFHLRMYFGKKKPLAREVSVICVSPVYHLYQCAVSNFSRTLLFYSQSREPSKIITWPKTLWRFNSFLAGILVPKWTPRNMKI